MPRLVLLGFVVVVVGGVARDVEVGLELLVQRRELWAQPTVAERTRHRAFVNAMPRRQVTLRASREGAERSCCAGVQRYARRGYGIAV